jgi:GNAT superfamily N-acetyltransferase
VWQHVALTGNGTAAADRWPDPSALIVETGGNYMLAGDPAALSAEEIRSTVKGFVDAPAEFVPLLRGAVQDLHQWPRMIFVLHGPFDEPIKAAVPVRRLDAADAPALAALSPASNWIVKTWGGPDGLAASRMAWGSFVHERLASVACPFFVGEFYEDLGVVTVPGHRGRGLSPACAAAVCADVRRRGRTPTWTTSPDNTASLRVAAKLGARLDRRDVLFVIGIPVPEPARPDHDRLQPR